MVFFKQYCRIQMNSDQTLTILYGPSQWNPGLEWFSVVNSPAAIVDTDRRSTKT